MAHTRQGGSTGAGTGGGGVRAFPSRPRRWFDRARELGFRYALLPLRIFLGVTFVYAGLDKLDDKTFLAAQGSGSIGELMRSVRDTSAVPWLVDRALTDPVAFGEAIAWGEIAVGVGTLVGLLGRLAALGGALISLSLWLTVSWQTTPYYYGNDLAYLMAWLPLVLAGAAAPSLDALIAKRRRRRA
ncbi:DoxX family protein [Streptomyces qinzhouensis]|uniref:DoxX family protein n=1 Tax=Streptomyces qinzhouensis TaxID=2599401 RepID=A0A5B8IM82_9ACTN|nr:DoxX family protein [Streptomyces qinzhouensis]QDY78599.1 DoxX family protein [Streptomyces qinzhouensis]